MSHLSPSNPYLLFCIILSYTHYLHVHFPSIHKSPPWTSSRPSAWQFQPQHPSTSILLLIISVGPLCQATELSAGLLCCECCVSIPPPGCDRQVQLHSCSAS
ncbi:hypothetical protein GOODEAATRI_021174 [Goodea atripinnis]|uniref:Uncharacterized protein n=1 Tax=Goodea atripinnis TaxID=208336 RepID=A0ABV0NCG9_9TELE